jgi:hypothetical protein
MDNSKLETSLIYSTKTERIGRKMRGSDPFLEDSCDKYWLHQLQKYLTRNGDLRAVLCGGKRLLCNDRYEPPDSSAFANLTMVQLLPIWQTDWAWLRDGRE